MNADEARSKSLDVKESQMLRQSAASDDSYNAVISVINKAVSNGGREITMNLGKIYYSVIPRLIANGYYITEIDEPGSCKVSW